jgi:hypothetical protein
VFTNECVQPFSDSPLRAAAVITHSGAGNDGAAEQSEQASSIEHARRRKRFSSVSDDFSPLVGPCCCVVVLYVCSCKRRRTPLFTSTPMHAQADDSFTNLEQGQRAVRARTHGARMCAVIARCSSGSEGPTTSGKFDDESSSDRSKDDDAKQQADAEADE